MKIMCGVVVVTLMAFSSQALQAKELKSGPQPGDHVGAYAVEKCAGNETDGVSDGQKLCYRCKLGNRPVVSVFARSHGRQLAALVKELNAIVEKNEDKKMASFVNLLGEDAEKLKLDARQLISDTKAKHVAIVVPEQFKDGPANYQIHPDAEVTVIVYNQGEVKANFALATGKLSKDAVEKIKNSVDQMLN